MAKHLLLILATVTLSFIILFISITQTAQVKYSFNAPSSKITSHVMGDKVVVDYHLPYTGRIAPDHFMWPLKAIRDRVWVTITPSALRRAELNLLFANKRLVSAFSLFKSDKPELGFLVLTKGEIYLEDSLEEIRVATAEDVDTKVFLYSLGTASLKHREVIKEILLIAPDDAKPEIAKFEERAKLVYEEVRGDLVHVDAVPPIDPF